MDVWNLFRKWRIALGCLARRKRARSSRSSSLSPLTEYQASEEKEDEEEEILAVLLSSSPLPPLLWFAWQRRETDDKGLWPSDHPWVGIF